MKKIILFALVMLMTVAILLSQNLGFNGAGFFENRTEQSDQWLKELNQPFTLRVPGGAVAKFADPYSNTKGWGLSHAAVDSIQTKYGSDEEEATAEALAKWHKRVDEQPNNSYLDELIEFQKLFPQMRVIWVANVFIPAQRTVNAIEYLLAGGVNIVTIEMGNETYAQLNYDYEKYKALISPLESLLVYRFDIPASHISANNKTRAQLKWNTEISAWLPAGDLITIHYYITEGTVEPENLLSFDTDFSYWFQTFSTASDFIVTETNLKPSAWVGNTWLNAAYLFKLSNEHRAEFQDLCWHNGVAPDRYAIIFNGKKDAGQIRNTSYYAFDLIGEAEEYFINTGEGYSISGKAIYYFADSLLSSALGYGEGSFIPKNSFGYILKPVRDTLICVDSIYLAGYRDTTIITYTVDTVLIDKCNPCDKWWYKFSHRFTCKYCRLFGNTEVVIRKHEEIVQIPVYATVQVCKLVKL